MGSSASWVREQINTPDTDFAVNLTNTDTTDNCVGNVVKGGQYCKVLLDFKPTHSQMELAAFEILADIGGTAQAVVVRGLGTDTTTDTITIQPGFVSLIGLPSSTGLTAGAPELTILPTANFTITGRNHNAGRQPVGEPYLVRNEPVSEQLTGGHQQQLRIRGTSVEHDPDELRCRRCRLHASTKWFLRRVGGVPACIWRDTSVRAGKRRADRWHHIHGGRDGEGASRHGAKGVGSGHWH